MDFGSPDAEVNETALGHELRVVQVASVQHDGVLQLGTETDQIQGGKFFPVSQDQQRISAVSSLWRGLYATTSPA